MVDIATNNEKNTSDAVSVLLKSVYDSEGAYTPYANMMKEQFPDISDNAIGFVGYYLDIPGADPEQHLLRAQMEDTFGTVATRQMEKAATNFKGEVSKDDGMPQELSTSFDKQAIEAEMEIDDEDDGGIFSAVGSGIGVALNDVRKLAPTQGNDAVEGVVTGAADAVRTIDGFADTLTGLGLQDDSDLGVFKFNPTEEQAAWLNENGMLRDGPVYNLAKKTMWRGETQGFTAGVETENRMSYGQFRAFKEAFPDSNAEYEGVLRSDALDGLAKRFDNLDSFSGGILRGITEFAGVSLASGGGLGAGGKAAVGIAIVKPALIDQVIYEEGDGLAIQAAVEATGNAAPLILAEVEGETMLNRTKLLGESLAFGGIAEGMASGFKALKAGDHRKAAREADAAKEKAVTAQYEVAKEAIEEITYNSKGLPSKVSGVSEELVMADNLSDVDTSYQSPRNITRLDDGEADAVNFPKDQPQVAGGFSNRNSFIAMRVQQAYKADDDNALAAKAKLAAGSVLKEDIDAEVLDSLTGVPDFLKTIGVESADEAIVQTSAGISKRYGKGKDNPLNRERTNRKAAHAHALNIVKKLKDEHGELPAAMVIDNDSPDAIADFEVRLAYLKGSERKISTLARFLRGDLSDPVEAKKMLEEIGEDWVLEIENEHNRMAVVVERVQELRRDSVAVAAKQKAEVRKGAQLLRAQGLFKTQEGQEKIENILKAQQERGEMSPQALGQRLAALEQATKNGKTKFASTKYDEGNDLFDDFLLYGQGNMLNNVNVLSLNTQIEPTRLFMMSTLGGFMRGARMVMQGNYKEAGRLARKATLFYESRKQLRRGLAGFAKVWRTSQADMSNSAASLGMENAEMRAVKSIGDTWRDTRKVFDIIPTLGIRAMGRVIGSTAYRIIAGISEFNTQVFYNHNVEMDALTGLYGPKWQQLRKDRGYLTDAEMSAMLMSNRAREELTSIGDMSYDTAYLKIAGESGFRNKEQGAIAAIESTINKNNRAAKIIKLAFPFMGMGLRVGRDAFFTNIPGAAFLSKTTRAKMGFSRGETFEDKFGNVRELDVETDQRVIDTMRAHYLAGPAGAMSFGVAAWYFNHTIQSEDEEVFYAPDPGAIRIKGVSSKFGDTDQGIVIEAGGITHRVNLTELVSPVNSAFITYALLDYTFDPARTTDELNIVQDVSKFLSIMSNGMFGQQSVVRGLQSHLSLIDAEEGLTKNLSKIALQKTSAYAPWNPFTRSLKTTVDEEMMRGSAKYDLINSPKEAIADSLYNIQGILDWNVGNKRRTVTGHLVPPMSRGLSPMSSKAELGKAQRYLDEAKLRYGLDLSKEKITVPGTEIDLSIVYLDSGQSIADAIAESIATAKYSVRAGSEAITLDDAMVEQFEGRKSELNTAHRALVVAAKAGEDPALQDNTGSDVLNRPEDVLKKLVKFYRDSAYEDFMKTLKSSSPAEFKRVDELVESRKGGAVLKTFTLGQQIDAEGFIYQEEGQ